MKLALVSDAWQPQVNGVVTTLVEVVRELQALGHQVELIEPGQFRTLPCPGYPGIDLAVGAGGAVARRLDACQPDAIHIATEGPLGWAARRHCLRQGLAFTTAFHTKFPEIAHAALRMPVRWGYSALRRFHQPSAGVMVPTQSVLRMLDARRIANLRPWTHGVDTQLFRFHAEPQDHPELGALPRPLALFVGRVSYEKNIHAFLELDLPGSKVVCGDGPVAQPLRRRYPGVHWLGVKPRHELPAIFGAADVLVFPSFADTFGLVMVEALACGTPVAAFHADGPLEVLGRPRADGRGSLGGAMHGDLRQAVLAALNVPRHDARLRALDYSWQEAAAVFLRHLVPARGRSRPIVTPA